MPVTPTVPPHLHTHAIKPSTHRPNNHNTQPNSSLISTNISPTTLRTSENHLYDVYQQNTQTRIKINQGEF